MASTIALLCREARSDYGVDFPDFPGCVSAGRTLDEARRMAAEALPLHIYGMLEDGAAMPAPSSLEAVMEGPDNRDAVGFLVEVPTRGTRPVRVNVTLPEELVAAIDRVTTNRSRFLSEAAREKLRVG